ncbi:MAG TPA: CehA/McbA family metallohydrolase [Chitinophaga sp.]|uniref:CehA/McbA family metallohydrolase n=1 Tax=Chitinophaga sp. TaxID=1869181 RepID=UPI002DBCFD5E|nr:CehA/McbA family metallohydrolase [Chitinophaga sp.]HEU4552001.1 CehA/McbA family metallohydrolase [Chitinophaga sp.]
MKLFLLIGTCLPLFLFAQHTHTPANPAAVIEDIDPQPLLAQALRLQDALTFLGSALPPAAAQQLHNLQQQALTPATAIQVQKILDPYCLAMVDINPEARVKVSRGQAKAVLTQGGWTSFLVKVHNQAGVTARLEATSANALPDLHIGTFTDRPVPEARKLTAGQVQQRFLEIQLYRNPPLLPNLSGFPLEYAVVQVYSKTAGPREADLGFNIGHGTQDIGFRNSIPVLFNIRPAVKVMLQVQDDDGAPAMAAFTITDGINRIPYDKDNDYRLNLAREEYGEPSNALTGIYPLPSRRVAAYDEYPDFFFQPQVYRSSGEHVMLAPGRYHITFTRGPEYKTLSRELVIPEGKNTITATFRLQRWVNMAKLGWYSADHHVHAAGCSHYESPQEGVTPADMWRQVLGEDLNVAAVLTWGPGWYHQKQYFTGQTDTLSTASNVMRYDVEVSGFPSSHCGHLVLLRLKEDDYPGTKIIEDWPSWTQPVLQWAHAQGAVTGYAHSGWGLEPTRPTTALPNNVLPKMDGIGANEYVVTVTKGLVDFYSAGDTPAPWELNMWYHTLNCGFRTRLSGETDFPCIFDERVGIARSYFKPNGPLSYESYVAAIKKGRCYVSDGRSHIIDFKVNGLEAGTDSSVLDIKAPQALHISARVAAMLPEQQDAAGRHIAERPLAAPYWHIEHARIGNSRKVAVELIVNGVPADTALITANGSWNNIQFTCTPQQSSWVALRILYSAHTNPVFVTINHQPVCVQESAAWCSKAVDQCWKMKQQNIRPAERAAAAAAYEQARNVYNAMIVQNKR